jgi:E3 ubiquitin-protein ligase NEDD4-like
MEQIFADLKHWTRGGISEPHRTEDYGASIGQELEHQLSISRGQFAEEGPALPAGWDWRRDQNGRILYVDHNSQRTTFNRPQVASAPGSAPDVEVRRPSYRRVVSHEDESQWVPQPDQSDQSDQPDQPDQADRQLSQEAGSLPPGWEMKFTKDGRPFYVDHSTSTTSWECPAYSKAIRSQLSLEIGALPQGWEEKINKNGKIFYVDHNSQNTTWEDPRFSMTGLDVPKYSLSYKKKSLKLQERIKALEVRKTTEINVRRELVVEDSLHQIKKIATNKMSQLRGKLWIDFMGEKGQDYGGVAREWFLLLSTKLFNPYYGLFGYSANDVYTLQINPDSGLFNEHHLEFFHFIGRIVGMAIFHKKLINGFFIRPFYSMMLGGSLGHYHYY